MDWQAPSALLPLAYVWVAALAVAAVRAGRRALAAALTLAVAGGLAWTVWLTVGRGAIAAPGLLDDLMLTSTFAVLPALVVGWLFRAAR
ncbi:MAG: hypothetical protein ACU0BF_12195 [Paracoccaceae bacterium]